MCYHFLFSLRKAFAALNDNPDIAILGNDMARRLPIFAMIIYHQDSGKLVHHNFVSVLLNDLYGIQARGGCACAGPYAQVSLFIINFFFVLRGRDPIGYQNRDSHLT